MLNNQSTSKICTHMVSLNKKTITQYLQESPAAGCDHLNNQYISLCLHCGRSFCGLYSSNDCLQNHQKQNKNHIMSLSIQTFFVFCTVCNDDLQSMIQDYSGDQSVPQFARKLRFISYIKQLWIKSDNFHKKSNQQKQILRLMNLGNTCFLNVILQLLNATQPLVQFYSNFKFEIGQKKSVKLLSKDIEMFYSDLIEKKQSQEWHIVGSKKSKEKKIIKYQIKNCTLNKAIRWMFISQQQSIIQNGCLFNPTEILTKISQYQPKYNQKKQQDADQLLNFMIDWLSEGELNSISYNKQKYDKIQKILGKQKLSICQNIFGTYLASRLICNQCQKVTWTLDLTYQLAVECKKQVKDNPNDIGQISIQYWQPLKYPKNKQINPLIRSFFSSETLTKSNNYYSCLNCSSVIGNKKLFLVSPPEILLITIKRFLGVKKYTDFVQFPSELDLSGVSLDRQSLNYDLFGVVCHQGTTINSGHYFCFIKKKQNWLRCSDDKVRNSNWKQVKCQQAYILAYKKKEQKIQQK